MHMFIFTFLAIQVELSATEVDEGDGSVTGCAVYSGLEGPTKLFLGSIGAASATPADRYGKGGRVIHLH